MADIQVIWDLEHDPDGNVRHIAEHDITPEEFEEVLDDHRHEATTSRSSGQAITFGWTSTGKYIAIVYEEVPGVPLIIRPITAYPTNPPKSKQRKKHGR